MYSGLMTYCFSSLVTECSQQVVVVARAMEEPTARQQLVGGASAELVNKLTREGLVHRATVQLTQLQQGGIMIHSSVKYINRVVATQYCRLTMC